MSWARAEETIAAAEAQGANGDLLRYAVLLLAEFVAREDETAPPPPDVRIVVGPEAVPERRKRRKRPPVPDTDPHRTHDAIWRLGAGRLGRHSERAALNDGAWVRYQTDRPRGRPRREQVARVFLALEWHLRQATGNPRYRWLGNIRAAIVPSLSSAAGDVVPPMRAKQRARGRLRGEVQAARDLQLRDQTIRLDIRNYRKALACPDSKRC
jgi:hypothetical protein